MKEDIIQKNMIFQSVTQASVTSHHISDVTYDLLQVTNCSPE